MTALSTRAYLLSLEQIGIKLGLEQIRGAASTRARPSRPRVSPPSSSPARTARDRSTAMVERGAARGRLPHGPLHVAAPRRSRGALRDRRHVRSTPRRLDRLARARARRGAAQLPAPPSFFEATTALALEVFRDARVDVAVLEVGLGGRLDATNVVDAGRRRDHGDRLRSRAVPRHHDRGDRRARRPASSSRASLVVLGANPPAVQAGRRGRRARGAGAVRRMRPTAWRRTRR